MTRIRTLILGAVIAATAMLALWMADTPNTAEPEAAPATVIGAERVDGKEPTKLMGGDQDGLGGRKHHDDEIPDAGEPARRPGSGSDRPRNGHSPAHPRTSRDEHSQAAAPTNAQDAAENPADSEDGQDSQTRIQNANLPSQDVPPSDGSGSDTAQSNAG